MPVVRLSQSVPVCQSFVFTGDRIEGNDVVEFRLVYSGRLLGASRNDSRASLKHELRREFHPQLKRLWETHPQLLEFSRTRGWDKDAEAAQERNQAAPDYPHYARNPHWEQRGIEIIANQWQRCGFRFVPLICEEYAVRASLKILFLRPEEPGMLIQSGDLDGRVKTIFDALRIPKNASETGNASPQEGEDPFFCLLEDDKLISEISVTADNLLMLPRERTIGPNDVLMVIHVSIKPGGHGVGPWTGWFD